MDAIILAGGRGTRLQEIISDRPKPLAPINGIPFLDILISKLQIDESIDKIILSVGYKKEKIIERYKNLDNIIFSEEKEPLGTGGAIKKAFEYIESENVLILNGDTYVDLPLKKFLNFHLKTNADITILSNFMENLSRYGSLKINKYTNKLISFEEKQDNNNKGYINSGVYIFNKNVFENILFDRSFSLEKDFFSLALSTKNVFAFKISSFFIDIGTKESYLDAQKLLIKFFK